MSVKNNIIYLHIRFIMERYCDKGKGCISYSNAKGVIGRFRIPREFRHKVINELIEMDLLHRINKHTLLLINSKDCKKLEKLIQEN